MQHITKQSLGQLAGQLFQKYGYLHEASMQSIKLLLMLETLQITKVAKSLMFSNLWLDTPHFILMKVNTEAATQKCS